MSLLRRQQGWKVAVVSAEEKKALILRILSHFITGENPETAGG